MEFSLANSRIEQFLQSIPGSRNDLLDVDCYIDNTGDFRGLKDVDVLVRSMINLLLTARGTYLFDPEFGCDVVKYVWEPADEITKSDIESELERSISRYEQRGEITYDVVFLSNKKGFVVNLYIKYKDTQKSVSITIDETLLKTLER